MGARRITNFGLKSAALPGWPNKSARGLAHSKTLARIPRALHHNVFHDSPVHVGQAEIAAGITIGELLVIDSH